jgi:hypothetical protein
MWNPFPSIAVTVPVVVTSCPANGVAVPPEVFSWISGIDTETAWSAPASFVVAPPADGTAAAAGATTSVSTSNSVAMRRPTDR